MTRFLAIDPIYELPLSVGSRC